MILKKNNDIIQIIIGKNADFTYIYIKAKFIPTSKKLPIANVISLNT